MDEHKAAYLESLIRSQYFWRVEDGGNNADLVVSRRSKLAELKTELKVEDEKEFCNSRARLRGES
jgi:hypothetical protein